MLQDLYFSNEAKTVHCLTDLMGHGYYIYLHYIL
jgi:hypothetical protein